MAEPHNMDDSILIVEKTNKTPYLKFDKNEGVIEISGCSIPENTGEFYWTFNRWLAEYSLKPAAVTNVKMALMYMNSSSAVVITRMLRTLDELIALKTRVVIEWHFEADDLEMKEMGEYYSELMKCEIKLIEVDRL
jgi:hypothetical protein